MTKQLFGRIVAVCLKSFSWRYFVGFRCQVERSKDRLVMVAVVVVAAVVAVVPVVVKAERMQET